MEAESTSVIAIVGMACRFPDANTPDEFWRNLCAGKESVRHWTEAEMVADGVPSKLLRHKGYVPASAAVEGADLFDAPLFGFTPKDAEITDPQIRMFLECAWEALEDAGYDSGRYPGRIAVYGSSRLSSYLLRHLEAAGDLGHRALLGNDKDYLPAWVSYKLNLRGPSIAVQTGCSSSLVGVHQACQCLLNGEADMALAGAASIYFPQKAGHLHKDGYINSPDGHCRAFDSEAAGTVRGNGAGIVLLKLLENAVADGDHIYAVIKASALNNDGSRKAGFTAPGVEGQRAVIAEAIALSGTEPGSIGYVEAHGTGTHLGDPAEIEALCQAFGRTPARQYCALGSVKTNLGHLDVAAGIAGLIKTALILDRGQIPPSLHYANPNPAIHFEETPFYVNTKLRPWPRSSAPRRACVSSFGLGGTNAHVVLEEAPEASAVSVSEGFTILPVSALTPEALTAAASNLASHMERCPEAALADVAHTLQAGRREMAHRLAVVAATPQETVEKLRAARILGGRQIPKVGPQVAFMFSGQGLQRPGMGRRLYETEEVFRASFDRCNLVCREQFDFDLKDYLDPEGPGDSLNQTAIAQPALFAFGYSLAQLWNHWGVQPAYVGGHSLGEYLAACAAGCLSVENGMRMVIERARIMQSMPPGAMLAARLSETRAARFLSDEIELCAVNGPESCVLGGPLRAVEALRTELGRAGVEHKALVTSHAFHTSAMDGALAGVEQAAARAALRPAEIPILSNLTGGWSRPEEPASHRYWGSHMRGVVRFFENLRCLAATPGVILLEIGPGRALETLAALHPELEGRTVASLQTPEGRRQELLSAAARLWTQGVAIRWDALHAGQRRRVSLPTYPFERKRYWLAPPGGPPREANQPKDESTNMTTAPSVAATPNYAVTLDRLKHAIRSQTGVDVTAIDENASFYALGADSLTLIALVQAVEEQFGVKIAFRRLFEDVSSLRALALYIESAHPTVPPQVPEPAPVSAKTAAPAPKAPPPVSVPLSAAPGVRELLAKQIDTLAQIMQQQLLVLQGQGPGQEISREDPPRAVAETRTAAEVQPASPAPSFRSPDLGGASEFTARQDQHLKQFISRYTARTRRSREQTQRYRQYLAEPRASLGFRMAWKDLIYPIIAERSSGSRLWDVDGNEYVDIAMGFGVNLFGHAPAFVRDAVREQLDSGFQLGPESARAGEVAELFSSLTRMPRVAFCNSGTEAVMGALRLARAATHRSRIVLFSGSYHGTFDGILARPGASSGHSALPKAPGIPRSMVEDVIVLPYGAPESLATIRKLGDSLAAVLVEPVQTRRPDLQPVEFLRDLRAITAKTGTALIFDEVVTGFRCHPGGAQALFGIDADIATYGKVLGGGLPIGAIGGRAEYIDAIDGGFWNYGDESYPQASQTIFAGTFCKHPLAMAAARAVLLHMKKAGAGLQEQLSERTTSLVARVNDVLGRSQAPIDLKRFGSMFFFIPSRSLRNLDLFFYHLVNKGIYLWEGRTCYLSTAHSDADCDAVVAAVAESVADLQRGTFLDGAPAAAVAALPADPKQVPATDMQRQIWFLSKMGDQLAGASHESVSIGFSGKLDEFSLRRSLAVLVDRYEILRTTFSADGSQQIVHPAAGFELPVIDFSRLEPCDRASELARAVRAEVEKPFDLQSGPLFRAVLCRTEPERHTLVITTHHIVSDDRSYTALIRELAAGYNAFARKEEYNPGPPLQFRAYAATVDGPREETRTTEDAEYWKTEFAGGLPELRLPTDRPRKDPPDYRTGRVSIETPQGFAPSARSFAAASNSTLFSLLLSGYQLLLHQLSCQDDLAVGINVAQQVPGARKDFIGCRINPLSIRSLVEPRMTVAEHLQRTRHRVLGATEHQAASVRRLNTELKARRNGSGLLLINASFNLDRCGAAPAFHGLESSIAANSAGYSALDISLNALEHPEGIRFECDYRVDILDEPTVRGWLAHLQDLILAMAGNPALPVADLPRLNPRNSAPFELTRYQKLLWAGQNLRPGVAMFVNAGYAVVPTVIDLEVFNRAVQALIDRADALRIVVESRDGVPAQKVLDRLRYQVLDLDFSSLPEPLAAAREWAIRRSQECHRLDQRLFDIAVIRLGAELHVQYVAVHHIVSDAWSIPVLIRHLWTYYELALNGRLDEAPALPSFRDWVIAQIADSGKVNDRTAEFWRRHMERPADPLRYYGRSAIVTGTEVVRERCDLGPARTERILERIGELGLPGAPNARAQAFFAAIVALFLREITGASRLFLGSPFHNRRGAEEMIGLLMQILPLHVEMRPGDDVGAVAHRIAGEQLRILRHRSQPLGNPLRRNTYQVEFNYIPSRNPVQFLGTPVEHHWIHPGHGNDALAVQVHQDEGGSFVTEFDFHASIFDAGSRSKSIADYLSVIDAFLDGKALDSGPLAETDSEMMFTRAFEAQAARTPDRIAAVFGASRRRYAELNGQANAVASELVRRGSGPEKVVAILAGRSLDYLVALLGVLKSGAAFLPLDPAGPPERLAEVARQAGCSHIVVEDKHRGRWDSVASSLDPSPVVISLGAMAQLPPESENPAIAPRPQSLCYIFFTSGSTGGPKGVMIEHRGMINHLRAKITDLHIEESDIVAQNASQCFDVSVWQFFSPLLVGACVSIIGDAPARDPMMLPVAVDQTGATVLEVVPSQMRGMVEASILAGERRAALTALRCLFVMGEVLPPGLCRQWSAIYPHTTVVNAYGVTECSDDVSHYALPGPPPEEAARVPVGGALPGAALYLSDSAMNPVETDQPGELYIGGICVGRGYIGDPRRTAEAFVPDPFAAEPGSRMYRTGDMAARSAGGIYDFLGRIDFQVKIRGHRVELEEVQIAIESHPAVAQATVAARPDRSGELRLAAYIVMAPQRMVDVSTLREYLEGKLPGFMCPANFIFLDRLPLNANGKVDRKRLPDISTERPELRDAFEPAGSDIEAVLAEVWAEVLGVQHVGIQDNFFDLGGDSILTIQIAARAALRSVHVTPMQIFENPTIAGLARIAGAKPAVVAEQGPVVGPVLLTPMQRWFFEQDQPNPHHWNQAVMLSVKPGLESVVAAAIDAVLQHHDALRLEFREADGQWRQEIAPPGTGGTAFTCVDLKDIPEAARLRLIREKADEAQSSFELHRSPLARFVYFDYGPGESARLLAVLHHLVVDGISMRLLLEDLESACLQLAGGRTAVLPAKTTSFRDWALRIDQYAQTADLAPAIRRLEEASDRTPALDVFGSPRQNTLESAKTITVEFAAEETRSLVEDVASQYQIGVEPVLLAGLAQALTPLTGSGALWVNLEGHGRDHPFEDVDITRTIGWFTSICPIQIDLAGVSTPLQAARSVKGHLEGAARAGFDYMALRYLCRRPEVASVIEKLPPAAVSFNYLGQLRGGVARDGLFQLTKEYCGRTAGPHGFRRHAIDVGCRIMNDKLYLDWTYSTNLHRPEEMEAGIQRHSEFIRNFLNYAISAPARPGAGFGWSDADLGAIEAALA